MPIEFRDRPGKGLPKRPLANETQTATQQTYLIYVGASFKPDTMLKAVRGGLATAPIIFSDYLLKLYIYDYLNRVRSSRQLEREAGRSVEVIWLTGRLIPDHKDDRRFFARTTVEPSVRFAPDSLRSAARPRGGWSDLPARNPTRSRLAWRKRSRIGAELQHLTSDLLACALS
jgi:hypothetical protein